MRASTSNPNGDRKTATVRGRHDLGPFSMLSRPHSRPPFLSRREAPVDVHFGQGYLPSLLEVLGHGLCTLSSAPLFTQNWNRRWHVWYGGYRSGRSFQGAPVRSTHRMPFSTSCRSRQGRPRPSARALGLGSKGSMISHCSFVRSMHTSYTAKPASYAASGPVYETVSSVTSCRHLHDSPILRSEEVRDRAWRALGRDYISWATHRFRYRWRSGKR
jgi:hypothetical protein